MMELAILAESVRHHWGLYLLAAVVATAFLGWLIAWLADKLLL
jgi:hypothetical protein